MIVTGHAIGSPAAAFKVPLTTRAPTDAETDTRVIDGRISPSPTLTFTTSVA